MNLQLQPDPVPLRIDENGACRVGKTRVLLELVIHAFQDGVTPESLVRDHYDTLELADVYAVIAYYLRHKQDVEGYLREREEDAVRVRKRIEALQPPRPGLKDDLLSRLAQRNAGHASPAE